VGDIIVALDGTPVRTEDDVYLALERRKPGEEVSVTYLRDGREDSVRVRLSAPEG
jgi:S1-C subfamily serine protease